MEGRSAATDPRGQRCRSLVYSLMLVACSGLLLALMAFTLSTLSSSQLNLETWREQAWLQTSCTFQAAGMAYRGTCRTGTLIQMQTYKGFRECLGPKTSDADNDTLKEAWKQTEAGICVRSGVRDFRSGVVNPPDPSKDLGSGGLPAPGRALLSSGGVTSMDEEPQCYNAFVVWVQVKIPGIGQRCAYRHGTEDLDATQSWHGARDELSSVKTKIGETHKCWLLQHDTCVVSLTANGMARDWLLQVGAALVVTWMMRILSLVGLAVAITMMLLGALWCAVDPNAVRLYIGAVLASWEPRGGLFRPLPTSDESEGEEVPLHTHVQRAIRTTWATLKAEAQQDQRDCFTIEQERTRMMLQAEDLPPIPPAFMASAAAAWRRGLIGPRGPDEPCCPSL